MDREGHVFRDMREIAALVTLLYAVMFVLTVRNGFERGGSLFTMPDVNLLFAAPIHPRRLLFYGLFRQMTASLLLGLFLLFQYANLHRLYGVTYGELGLMVAGYAAAIFLGQVTAVLLYAFTSESERRQRAGKTVFYLVIIVFVLAIGAASLPGGREGLTDRAVEAILSIGGRFFPAAGWLGLAVGGVLRHVTADVVLGVGMSVLYLAALVGLILLSNPDYYEDVLGSAEAAHSAITAPKRRASWPRLRRAMFASAGPGWAVAGALRRSILSIGWRTAAPEPSF